MVEPSINFGIINSITSCILLVISTEAKIDINYILKFGFFHTKNNFITITRSNLLKMPME